MAKIRLVGISAAVLVIGCAALARAGASGESISTKKLFIKDHPTKATKRQVQVLSSDPAVQFSDAGGPADAGASLHLYSATDDYCVTLPPGAEWKNKNDKWTYKSKVTKNSAQIKDGKLLVSIKSGVTFTLADDTTQGTVNAQVRFGTGPRFCLRCPGNKKDKATKFLGKDCAAAPCDPEPSACNSTGTTTTTTTGGGPTTTTTTLPSGGGVVLKGALTATPGRFNYNLTLGLPGADSACGTNFAGTHACTYAELQSAEAAGDLDGLRDTGSTVVTGFWAIDPNAPALQQCVDDAGGGSNLNWEYGTAHTPSRGQKVALTNATGVLGPLQSNLQCNLSGAAWVGCCL